MVRFLSEAMVQHARNAQAGTAPSAVPSATTTPRSVTQMCRGGWNAVVAQAEALAMGRGAGNLANFIARNVGTTSPALDELRAQTAAVTTHARSVIDGAIELELRFSWKDRQGIIDTMAAVQDAFKKLNAAMNDRTSAAYAIELSGADARVAATRALVNPAYGRAVAAFKKVVDDARFHATNAAHPSLRNALNDDNYTTRACFKNVDLSVFGGFEAKVEQHRVHLSRVFDVAGRQLELTVEPQVTPIRRYTETPGDFPGTRNDNQFAIHFETARGAELNERDVTWLRDRLALARDRMYAQGLEWWSPHDSRSFDHTYVSLDGSRFLSFDLSSHGASTSTVYVADYERGLPGVRNGNQFVRVLEHVLQLDDVGYAKLRAVTPNAHPHA